MPKQLSDSVPNMPVVLEVGPAGSGKTTFMTRLKWPDKKTYIIDVDKNLAGPRKVAGLEKRDLSHVIYDHIDTNDEDKPVDALNRYLRLASLLSRAVADPSYGVICITSTTSLVPVFMNEVRRQMSKPVDAEFKGFDMWGKFSQLWQHFIAALRASNKFIVLDGHLQVEKGELDQVLRYALAIPGSTGDLLPMQLTDVWLFGVDQKPDNGVTKDYYMIQTVQTNQYPNMKSSLDLPRRFEATQAMADSIIKQLLPVVAS